MAEDIVVPPLGESITEATIGNWMKDVGEAVEADEPVVELETDKVAMEVNAPAAGVLSEQAVKEGDTVEVGAVIGKIDTEGKAAAKSGKEDKEADDKDKTKAAEKDAKAEKAEEAEEAEKSAPEEKTGQKDKAAAADKAETDKSGPPMSPAVRRLITDYNLEPDSIEGTGKGGRLTKGDVLKAIEQGSARTRATGAPAAAAAAPAEESPREERVPMTRLRKRIAERLKEAQNTAAMLTTYNDVDMSAVIASRKKYRDLFEKKHGIRLGFMSFFVKAACLALREVPTVNARIDGDDIVYQNFYDIGVAVSAPQGLVVPIVRDADQLSFADTEKTIADYGRRARDGKLKLDELQGGTFSISNGGIFGSLLSSPILNPPQSGILGMHRIEERPVVVDGEIVIRPMMYLALSYDHRIIDGREAVTFLVRMKEAIEDPSRLLLDL